MPTHGVGMVAAVRNQSIRINGRDVLCNFTAELVMKRGVRYHERTP